MDHNNYDPATSLKNLWVEILLWDMSLQGILYPMDYTVIINMHSYLNDTWNMVLHVFMLQRGGTYSNFNANCK